MSDLSALRHRRGQRSFEAWDGDVSPKLVAEAEEAVRHLIDKLIGLGTKPTQEQVEAEVNDCVQKFNDLDASAPQSWIHTIEREDIGDVIAELVELCGFDGNEDWLSDRDW